MLDSKYFDVYHKSVSYIHALHPLTKFICSLLCILSILLCSTYTTLCILAGLLSFTVFLLQIPILYYKKLFLWFLPIPLLVSGVLLLFFSPLDVLFVFLKLYFLYLTILLIRMSTSSPEIVTTVTFFVYPFCKTEKNFYKISYFFFAFIEAPHLWIELYDQALEVIASKGLDYKHSRFEGKWIAYKTAFLYTSTHFSHKIRQLSLNMWIRNFKMQKRRTNYRYYSFHILDAVLFLIYGIIMVLTIIEVVK